MTRTATWFETAVAWLDSKGKGAWLTAMILGFVFIWPIGLAILFYMIWSNRMHSFFNGSCKTRRHNFKSSGNTAFDAYKADTLSRLEEEQVAFQSFLQRLREAKDKTEFDEFMDERAHVVETEAAEADEKEKA